MYVRKDRLRSMYDREIFDYETQSLKRVEDVRGKTRESMVYDEEDYVTLENWRANARQREASDAISGGDEEVLVVDIDDDEWAALDEEHCEK